MRIVFISDIHGVPSTLEQAFASASTLGYDKIVLLGDLLYHGPRNGVPDFYDPVKVAQMLNLRKDRIIAVRGNCDAEVDQMMFEFPMMSDYAVLEAGAEDVRERVFRWRMARVLGGLGVSGFRARIGASRANRSHSAVRKLPDNLAIQDIDVRDAPASILFLCSMDGSVADSSHLLNYF